MMQRNASSLRVVSSTGRVASCGGRPRGRGLQTRSVFGASGAMKRIRSCKLVSRADEKTRESRLVVNAKGSRDTEEVSLNERIASGEFDDSGSTKEKMTRPLRKMLAKEPFGIGALGVKGGGICLMDV